MKKRILYLFISFTVLISGCKAVPEKTTQTFFAMNTYMSITLYEENSAEIIGKTINIISELEHLWSVTDENSEIYAINNSFQPVYVSDYTADLIDFSLDMAEKTEGKFDPTIYPVLTAWGFTTGENRVPDKKELSALLPLVDYSKVILEGNTVTLSENMALDSGAVAKGFTGDIVESFLKEQGITSALLDVGGNIQAIGSKPDGTDWEIGLRSPFSDGLAGILEVSDLSVITSGNYERFFIDESGVRYGHIIDPETGYPADNGMASVTVIGNEGRECDALSTALYVMGYEKAVEYWHNNGGFDMILISENGNIFLTPYAAEIFTPESGWNTEIIS